MRKYVIISLTNLRSREPLLADHKRKEKKEEIILSNDYNQEELVFHIKIFFSRDRNSLGQTPGMVTGHWWYKGRKMMWVVVIVALHLSFQSIYCLLRHIRSFLVHWCGHISITLLYTLYVYMMMMMDVAVCVWIGVPIGIENSTRQLPSRFSFVRQLQRDIEIDRFVRVWLLCVLCPLNLLLIVCCLGCFCRVKALKSRSSAEGTRAVRHLFSTDVPHNQRV